MGIHFRKSFKIAPGIRLNLGNKSSSLTFGGKLFRKTFSSTGRRTTSSSIPGTGLHFTKSSGGKSRRRNPSKKRSNTNTTSRLNASAKPNSENGIENTQADSSQLLGCLYLIIGIFAISLILKLLTIGVVAFALLFPLLLIPMWRKCEDWSSAIKGLITGLVMILWFLILVLFAVWAPEDNETIDPVIQGISVESTPEYFSIFQPTDSPLYAIKPEETTPPSPAPMMMTVPTSAPTTAPTTEPTPTPTTVPTDTPEPTASPIPVLKKGMTGDAVVEMQRRLIDLEYLDGKADGDFGSSTEQAVKDFQKKHNLSADGIAGAKTLNMLFSEKAKHQVWVWIPTKGGTKYHTNSGCSDMIDPVKVKLEEAEKRGFEPCKKC